MVESCLHPIAFKISLEHPNQGIFGNLSASFSLPSFISKAQVRTASSEIVVSDPHSDRRNCPNARRKFRKSSEFLRIQPELSSPEENWGNPQKSSKCLLLFEKIMGSREVKCFVIPYWIPYRAKAFPEVWNVRCTILDGRAGLQTLKVGDLPRMAW